VTWQQLGQAIAAEVRVALMLALRYRITFLAESVMALGWIVWTVAPLVVVFRHRPEVAGWTENDALLVMGFFLTIEGLLSAFVDPNLRAVVEQVRDGSFDFTLLKPIDPQLHVSIHRTQPTELPHAIAGLAVVGFAAHRLATPPGPGDVAAAGLLLLCGLAVLHAVWTAVVATSFWFVRVDNLSILLRSALDAGRWPVSFYKGAVRIGLTWVLPIGLMTSFPAEALRGTLAPGLLLGAVVTAIGFTVLGRLVWTFALRHYTSASS
jgi:ABC-2 type transport system permease protein